MDFVWLGTREHAMYYMNIISMGGYVEIASPLIRHAVQKDYTIVFCINGGTRKGVCFGNGAGYTLTSAEFVNFILWLRKKTEAD